MSRAGLSGAFFISVMLLAGAHRTQAQATPAATPLPYAEFGRIETEVQRIRERGCGTFIVHGTFHNPYAEPVSGVRLIVRLRGAGAHPQVLDRIENEIPRTIAPGESVTFHSELSTGCTTRFDNILFVAFAERRGAAELPTPSRKVEVAASTVHEGTSTVANVPLVNQPGGIFNFTFP